MKLEVGKGIYAYVEQLENLEFTAGPMIGKAIYAGAKIVADEISRNIDAIPTDDRPYVEEGVKRTGLKSIQKAALKASFGIAPEQNQNGYINVKLGFDGYNQLQSKKYPKGQPNAMIARTIESGNSFTQKHPFIAPAVRWTKASAELEMQKVIDTELYKKISQGG